MERTYKAFISYRHLPLDIKIAKKLHRRIENFVIPKKLRKDGQKKPGLVFRDQDELPTSSDLSAGIQDALNHSEFLIVICSPSTPSSHWVLQEIECFLEHHDRNHILTVLADGRPEESFPALLTEITDPAAGVTKEIEPLAANMVADSEFRRNRLFRTESLRILAALIGCSYDELYHREQRYKTRRLLAAAGVLLTFAAIFVGILLNRNAVIRDNYLQALRNQSVYLAKESLDLEESGDRLGAIALAMEALPSGDRERPLVSKAEFALGVAAHAYLSPGNAAGLTGSGILHHSTSVSSFLQNKSGDTLCTLVKDNVVVCWDPFTLRKKWEVDLGRNYMNGDIGCAGFLNDRDPVYWTSAFICCYDGETGETKWKKRKEELLGDTSYSNNIYKSGFVGEGKEILVTGSEGAALLDAATGEKHTYFDWPELLVNGEEASYSVLSALTDSQSYLVAVQFSTGAYPDELRGLAVIDAAEGKIRARTGDMPDTDLYFPYKYVFPDEDHVIFVTSDLSGGSAYTMMGSFNAQLYSSNILHCLDLNTGEIAWTSEHRSSITGANDILLLNDTIMDRQILAYAYSNHLDIVDPADGKVLSAAEYPSRIISLDAVGSRLVCVTEDGLQGYLEPENPDQWYSTSNFTDRILQAESRKGSVWLVSQNNPEDLVHYSPSTPDPAWRDTPVMWLEPDTAEDFYPDDYFLTDGCFALLDDYRLLVSDGTPEGPIKELELPHGETSYPRTKYYMGNLHDGMFSMFCSGEEGIGIIHVDMASYRYARVLWEQKDLRIVSMHCSDTGSEYFAVCCQDEGDEENPVRTISLCVLDDELKIRKQATIGSFKGLTAAQSFLQDDRYVYIFLPEVPCTYCIDVQKDRVSVCHEEISEAFARILEEGTSEDFQKQVCFCPGTRKLAAETAPGAVDILDADRGKLFTIQADMTDVLSMMFSPDGKYLLTLDTGGYMSRFRTDSGTLAGRTEIWFSGTLSPYREYCWQFTDRGFLVLTADNCANLISLQDWGVYAYVLNCYGYEETADFFPCFSYISGSRMFGGFMRHTTEALLEYGESLLNGWELSPSQREQYGLENEDGPE